MLYPKRGKRFLGREQMTEIKVKCGDSLEVLKTYADNSIDSIVTDGPYGLGKEPDMIKVLSDWIEKGYHEVSGSGFMGKKWDAFVPQPLFWKECLRVLKPGGFLLCFFGTRTYDLGTVAIRLAGFEIRDQINWIYGSGFPKNLDVSVAIDKKLGVQRTKVREGKAVKRMIPGADQEKSGSWIKDDGREYVPNKSESNTELGKKFQGYGTALKPAIEPICVARKPLDGTVANNYIKYGTGGINIDGCRIDFDSDEDKKSAVFGRGTDILGGNYVGAKHSTGQTNIAPNDLGRYPSNVIFDDAAAALLDEQSGVLTSGKPCGVRKSENKIYGKYKKLGEPIVGFGDSGGASRFFYCAKPSQEEKNAGCEHLELKDPAAVSDFRPTLKSNPENWENTESAYMRTTQRNNNHPTVKPINLMRYLIRLVTPVGGICLDPFAGSGTTGCASLFEDLAEMHLIDLEDEYIPIINARVAYWSKESNRNAFLGLTKKVKPSVKVKNQNTLF